MSSITDFSIDAILGLKKENKAADHIPKAVAQSALIAGPPRHQQRRNRTVFTDNHIIKLQSIFELNQYPDIRLREQLAQETAIPESRIQVWFQNRRMRTRRKVSSIATTRSTVCLQTTRRNQKLSTSSCTEKMEAVSSAVRDPLFQLPDLISPLPSSPAFCPRLFSMFDGVTTPITPLPLTPTIRSNLFAFSNMIPCRDFSTPSFHLTRSDDGFDSSRSSPDSAVDCIEDDDNDLVIDIEF